MKNLVTTSKHEGDASQKFIDSPNWSKNLAKGLVLLVGIIHLYPFLTGYRLTADDVAYHWYAMNGIAESWQFIKGTAISQGRIVHFPDLITSLVGAYYADSLLFRIFYTTLYFINFWIFAFYINKICSSKVGYFLVLVLFIFHPLNFSHTSPGSYPFKISIPIFIILTSRIIIADIRGGKYKSLKYETPLAISCLVAMLFSEYAFSFGLSLMVIEFAMRSVNIKITSNLATIKSIAKNLGSRETTQDVVTILFFLVTYIGFRMAFPSEYDGNNLPENLDVVLFTKTMVGHILGSSVISSFLRYENLDYFLQGGIGWTDYLLVIILAVATFLAAFLLMREHCQNSNLGQASKKIKIVAVSALSVALIVTAPVAITTKYQSWCGKLEYCIFLDSSLSYLGFGAFLATLLLLLSNVVSKIGAAGIYLLGALIAFGAAATQLNNLRVESSMADYVQGWARAKALSCYSEGELAAFSDLGELVEPSPRIDMHPNFDPRSYWLLYVKDQRQRGICSSLSPDIDYPFLELNVDKKIYFSNAGKGAKHVVNGWSSPEEWGVWSDQERATIALKIKSDHKTLSIEANAFVNKFHPFQRIGVSINGVPVNSSALERSSGNIIAVDIPEAAKSNSSRPRLILVEFKFSDAISPLQLGIGSDNRKLALGLISMKVR